MNDYFNNSNNNYIDWGAFIKETYDFFNSSHDSDSDHSGQRDYPDDDGEYDNVC